MGAKYLPSPADDIAAGQGWSDSMIIMHLANFIQKRCLISELAVHLSEQASLENDGDSGVPMDFSQPVADEADPSNDWPC